MKASEALEISQSNQVDTKTLYLRDLFSEIEKSASRGMSLAVCNARKVEICQLSLVDLGYRIGKTMELGKTHYTIVSWNI